MTDPKGAIRVFLVDDQAVVRASLRSLLEARGDLALVGDSGGGPEAVEAIRKARPDVVLLDISMPVLSGLDLLPRIREALPRTRVVMLTNHEGESIVEQALANGADGYLSKSSEPEELAIAIRAAHAGAPYVSPRVSKGLVRGLRGPEEDGSRATTRLASLTPREREVFQLLALGRSNKEVAHALGMTVGTAKKHRENLQRKLACSSPAELAQLAVREGLVDA
ncbi:MAG TPA: response regulator transcription factor [Planctomycetota bacterium]